MKKISIIILTALLMPLVASGQNITFKDSEVKKICIQNWDTNGDGELNESEAAAVTDIGTKFQENRSIHYFDELKYFTDLTRITSKVFRDCSDTCNLIP